MLIDFPPPILASCLLLLQDESDQALAAYRTAARLFPGLHTPLLGMGTAYQRMNNLHLCERCFLQAYNICPHDPAIAHELGVLAYRYELLTYPGVLTSLVNGFVHHRYIIRHCQQ